MKAAVFQKRINRSPLRMWISSTLGRARYWSVRPARVYVIRFAFCGWAWQLPTSCVLGQEAAGVVEAIGEGVTYVKPGDRVIMSFRPFCGTCYYCLSGRPNLVMIHAQCAQANVSPGKGNPFCNLRR